MMYYQCSARSTIKSISLHGSKRGRTHGTDGQHPCGSARPKRTDPSRDAGGCHAEEGRPGRLRDMAAKPGGGEGTANGRAAARHCRILSPPPGSFPFTFGPEHRMLNRDVSRMYKGDKKRGQKRRCSTLFHVFQLFFNSLHEHILCPPRADDQATQLAHGLWQVPRRRAPSTRTTRSRGHGFIHDSTYNILF